MSKIVMPKNSAVLNEIEAVLKIYNDASGWLSNDDYKVRLKEMIGDDQYASSYTKKAQVPAYYGFVEWQNINDVRSPRRITQSGKQFYQYLCDNDLDGMASVIMDALEKVNFGRKNFGAPDSDSDIEAPVLFIRAIVDLGYLTYKEFAYILWNMLEKGKEYTDTLRDIVDFRRNEDFTLPAEAQKYTDAKPIMILLRWGFLAEDEEDNTGGAHILLSERVRTKYLNRIKNLKIYNIDKNANEGTEDVLSSLKLTPEWFKEKSKEFPDFDVQTEELRKEFLSKYGPEELKKVEGMELLRKIFINDVGSECLCHEMEYSEHNKAIFGSIKGGSAFKYSLYYSRPNNTWLTGTHHNPVTLTEKEAIIKGTEIRNSLLAGVECISACQKLETEDDYLQLYQELKKVTNGLVDKIWFLKYYHILFPDLLPSVYTQEGQEEILHKVGEIPSDNVLVRMAQICSYAKKCDLSNNLFCKIFFTFSHEFEAVEDTGSSVGLRENNYPYENAVKRGENLIIYGTPGCGKSYYVKHTLLKDYSEENVLRTTFYQDYTNTDFVGQIIPVIREDKSVTYEFRPGPFTIALKRALSNPKQQIALVIEEINRGNAPSIFGDIFQLLDRNNGISEYQITNVHIQKYLTEELPNYTFDTIRIPANMSIIATMNTSDQNVFTLDTAFKRRWNFEKLPNVFSKDHPYKDYFVPGMDNRTWEEVVTTLNEFLVSNSTELQSEDKQIGVYFVSEQLLSKKADESNDQNKRKKFAYKLLEYLWNDVAKFERTNWFGNIKSLDELIGKYIDTGETVFSNAIFTPKNK